MSESDLVFSHARDGTLECRASRAAGPFVAKKRVIVMFRAYSENELFLYDENMCPVTTTVSYYRANTLLIINWRARFDQNASGVVIFDKTITVARLPLSPICCLLNEQRISDAYSLSRFVHRPEIDDDSLIFVEY